MTHTRIDEAARWFCQASYDLKACRWNIEGRFYDTACFLAQQSAEKALKSALYYLGSRRKVLLTHSLVEMIKEAGKRISGLTSLVEQARRLDLHYVPSRYPNGLPSGYPHQFYGRETAEEALRAAAEITAVISDYFRSEGQVVIIQSDDLET